MIIYIVLFIIIMLVYSVGLTWNRENFFGTLLESEPTLNTANVKRIEYNRQDIPIDIKEGLSKRLTSEVLLKTGKRITPLGWDTVILYDDGDKQLWYIEAFTQYSYNFTTQKIIWEFWNLGGKYLLKNLRLFSENEGSDRVIPDKLFGVNKNLVITSDNLTDPFQWNTLKGICMEDPTVLENTPICDDVKMGIIKRQGAQPYARQYNQWILPNTIWDKNAYVSFTPDILQNVLYNDGTYNDLFSRTRHDPSFPHGRSTA